MNRNPSITTRRPWVAIVAAGIGLATLAACGGGGGGSTPTPPPPTIAVTVTAPSATLNGEFSQATAPPAATTSMTVTARVRFDGAGGESSVQVHNALPPCGLSGGSTTATYTVSSTGRIHIPDSGGNPLAAAYLIDPGRYVLVLQRQSGAACDEVVQINYAEQ